MKKNYEMPIAEVVVLGELKIETSNSAVIDWWLDPVKESEV